MRSVRRAVAAVAATFVLASCGSSGSSAPADGGSGGSGGSVSPPHIIQSSPATLEPSESASLQGSAEHPVAVEPTKRLLDWKTVPGSTEDLVTVGDGGWTLTLEAGGVAAWLRGDTSVRILAQPHWSITDAYLDDKHALIVEEDRLADDPDRARVVDLAAGRMTILDGGSDPPTVAGGTWALGPQSVVHATSGDRRRYCLATVDLADGSGSTGWCAAPRHGFRGAAITTDGTSMLTFDDHRPSCRTVDQVSGTDLIPFPGVPECKGWDGAMLDGTTIWSVVRNEHRIDAAHFYAHTDAGWFDLGPGTTGSLVTCAGDAFFTRDPDARTDPATLMRWSPDDHSLSIAYESQGSGHAFLSPPRCGGTHLTVTAYSQGGDEQVTTSLG